MLLLRGSACRIELYKIYFYIKRYLCFLFCFSSIWCAMVFSYFFFVGFFFIVIIIYVGEKFRFRAYYSSTYALTNFYNSSNMYVYVGMFFCFEFTVKMSVIKRGFSFKVEHHVFLYI